MAKFRRFFLSIWIVIAVCGAVLGWVGESHAAERMWRIGFLSLTNRDSFHDSFLKGLRELGYAEQRNLVVDSRHAAPMKNGSRTKRSVWRKNMST